MSSGERWKRSSEERRNMGLLSQMLFDARGFVQQAWWMAVFPGLAIVLTVLSFNLIGDALRDVLDPRRRTQLDAAARP